MTYWLVEDWVDGRRVLLGDPDSLFDADRHSACPAEAKRLGQPTDTYCQRAFFLIDPEPEEAQTA